MQVGIIIHWDINWSCVLFTPDTHCVGNYKVYSSQGSPVTYFHVVREICDVNLKDPSLKSETQINMVSPIVYYKSANMIII